MAHGQHDKTVGAHLIRYTAYQLARKTRPKARAPTARGCTKKGGDTTLCYATWPGARFSESWGRAQSPRSKGGVRTPVVCAIKRR